MKFCFYSFSGFVCIFSVVMFFFLMFSPCYGHDRQFQIRITNRFYGSIEISHDNGLNWEKAGKVLRPLNGKYKVIQPREFTASDWAPTGAVAATAVNAIHVKVGHPGPHAAVFSILPCELLPGMERPASYFDEPSTLYTDNQAGTGLFGKNSPVVGSPFFLCNRVTGKLSRPDDMYAPKIGDCIVFQVDFSLNAYDKIVFENVFNGKVTAYTALSEPQKGMAVGEPDSVNDSGFDEGTVIARVLRPVTGTGRFGGSKYVETGLLRANHPGVICISTGPVGELGGFQIIPSGHASDLDLPYVRTVPAWMVVGPVRFEDPPLEGQWPLFKGLFRPCQWKVQFRWVGSEVFEPVLPPITGKKLSAMLNVGAIALERVRPFN